MGSYFTAQRRTPPMKKKKKTEEEVISRLRTVTTSLLEAVQHRQFFDGSAPYTTKQSYLKAKNSIPQQFHRSKAVQHTVTSRLRKPQNKVIFRGSKTNSINSYPTTKSRTDTNHINLIFRRKKDLAPMLAERSGIVSG